MGIACVQIKQYTAAEDEIKKIDQEIRGKIEEVLTADQKANLKKAKDATA